MQDQIPKYIALIQKSDAMYDQRICSKLVNDVKPSDRLIQFTSNTRSNKTIDYSNKYGLMVCCAEKDVGLKSMEELNTEFTTGNAVENYLELVLEETPYIVEFSSDESLIAVVMDTKILVFQTITLSSDKSPVHTIPITQPVTDINWSNNTGIIYWKYQSTAYHYSFTTSLSTPFPQIKCSSAQYLNNHFVLCEQFNVHIFNNQYSLTHSVTYPDDTYKSEDFYGINMEDIVSIAKINNLDFNEFKNDDVYAFITVFCTIEKEEGEDTMMPNKYLFFCQGDIRTENVEFRGGQLLYHNNNVQQQYIEKVEGKDRKRGFSVKHHMDPKTKLFVMSIDRSQQIYSVDAGIPFQKLRIIDFPGKYQFRFDGFVVGFTVMKTLLDFERNYTGDNVDLKMIVDKFEGKFLNIGIKESDKDIYVLFPLSVVSWNHKGVQNKQYLVRTQPEIDTEDSDDVKQRKMRELVEKSPIVETVRRINVSVPKEMKKKIKVQVKQQFKQQSVQQPKQQQSKKQSQQPSKIQVPKVTETYPLPPSNLNPSPLTTPSTKPQPINSFSLTGLSNTSGGIFGNSKLPATTNIFEVTKPTAQVKTQNIFEKNQIKDKTEQKDKQESLDLSSNLGSLNLNQKPNLNQTAPLLKPVESKPVELKPIQPSVQQSKLKQKPQPVPPPAPVPPPPTKQQINYNKIMSFFTNYQTQCKTFINYVSQQQESKKQQSPVLTKHNTQQIISALQNLKNQHQAADLTIFQLKSLDRRRSKGSKIERQGSMKIKFSKGKEESIQDLIRGQIDQYCGITENYLYWRRKMSYNPCLALLKMPVTLAAPSVQFTKIVTQTVKDVDRLEEQVDKDYERYIKSNSGRSNTRTTKKGHMQFQFCEEEEDNEQFLPSFSFEDLLSYYRPKRIQIDSNSVEPMIMDFVWLRRDEQRRIKIQKIEKEKAEERKLKAEEDAKIKVQMQIQAQVQKLAQQQALQIQQAAMKKNVKPPSSFLQKSKKLEQQSKQQQDNQALPGLPSMKAQISSLAPLNKKTEDKSKQLTSLPKSKDSSILFNSNTEAPGLLSGVTKTQTKLSGSVTDNLFGNNKKQPETQNQKQKELAAKIKSAKLGLFGNQSAAKPPTDNLFDSNPKSKESQKNPADTKATISSLFSNSTVPKNQILSNTGLFPKPTQVQKSKQVPKNDIQAALINKDEGKESKSSTISQKTEAAQNKTQPSSSVPATNKQAANLFPGTQVVAGTQTKPSVGLIPAPLLKNSSILKPIQPVKNLFANIPITNTQPQNPNTQPALVGNTSTSTTGAGLFNNKPAGSLTNISFLQNTQPINAPAPPQKLGTSNFGTSNFGSSAFGAKPQQPQQQLSAATGGFNNNFMSGVTQGMKSFGSSDQTNQPSGQGQGIFGVNNNVSNPDNSKNVQQGFNLNQTQNSFSNMNSFGNSNSNQMNNPFASQSQPSYGSFGQQQFQPQQQSGTVGFNGFGNVPNNPNTGFNNNNLGSNSNNIFNNVGSQNQNQNKAMYGTRK